MQRPPTQRNVPSAFENRCRTVGVAPTVSSCSPSMPWRADGEGAYEGRGEARPRIEPLRNGADEVVVSVAARRRPRASPSTADSTPAYVPSPFDSQTTRPVTAIVGHVRLNDVGFAVAVEVADVRERAVHRVARPRRPVHDAERSVAVGEPRVRRVSEPSTTSIKSMRPSPLKSPGRMRALAIAYPGHGVNDCGVP